MAAKRGLERNLRQRGKSLYFRSFLKLAVVVVFVGWARSNTIVPSRARRIGSAEKSSSSVLHQRDLSLHTKVELTSPSESAADSARTLSIQPIEGPNTTSFYAIWVGGLSHKTREVDLTAVFRPYARKNLILSVFIKRQLRTTVGADDLGFVNFFDEDDATAAYDALRNGTIIHGKRIKLKPPRRKVGNLTELMDYHQSSIRRDLRPSENIPIRTKSVYRPTSSRGGRPYRNYNSLQRQFEGLQIGGRQRYKKGYYSEKNKVLSPQGTTSTPTSPRSSPPPHTSLDLSRPWIDRPQSIRPFYIGDLRTPSAYLPKLLNARVTGGQSVMNELQRGMVRDTPYISVAGCPSWVPAAVLPHAINFIRQPSAIPTPMLVVLGRPRKGDLSLDMGVLDALESVQHLLAKPAIPLISENYLQSPPHRPSSYLLFLKPRAADAE